MGLKSGLYGRRKRKPAYKNTEIELTEDQKVSQFFEKQEISLSIRRISTKKPVIRFLVEHFDIL